MKLANHPGSSTTWKVTPSNSKNEYNNPTFNTTIQKIKKGFDSIERGLW